MGWGRAIDCLSEESEKWDLTGFEHAVLFYLSATTPIGDPIRVDTHMNIAKKLHLHRKTVERAIKGLCKKGFLYVQTAKGAGKKTNFVLLLDDMKNGKNTDKKLSTSYQQMERRVPIELSTNGAESANQLALSAPINWHSPHHLKGRHTINNISEYSGLTDSRSAKTEKKEMATSKDVKACENVLLNFFRREKITWSHKRNWQQMKVMMKTRGWKPTTSADRAAAEVLAYETGLPAREAERFGQRNAVMRWRGITDQVSVADVLQVAVRNYKDEDPQGWMNEQNERRIRQMESEMRRRKTEEAARANK